MKKIPLGLCSCVLAALVWIGSCGGVVTVLTNQLFFFKHETGNLLLNIGMFTSLGMAMLGVVLAIGGFMQTDRKKVFAVLGLIFNGLFLLGFSGLLVLAWCEAHGWIP